MTVEVILASLKDVKQTGPAKWRAKCPAHQGDSQSLSVTLNDEGVVMINCFAGCKGSEVMAAIGLPMRTLYPPTGQGTTSHLSLAHIALKAVKRAQEAITLSHVGLAMHMNGDLSESDLRTYLSRGQEQLAEILAELDGIFEKKRQKIQ